MCVISLSCKAIMIFTVVLFLAILACSYGSMSLSSISSAPLSLIKDALPTSVEGQLAAGAAGGCAVGFIMGPKGCMVGGVLGLAATAAHLSCPIKDKHGITACIDGLNTIHYGVDDDDSIFPMCPAVCVHLNTVETFEISITVQSSDGKTITIKKVYAEFRVPIRNGEPILNQPVIRDEVLNAFYKRGESLVDSVLKVPLEECLTAYSSANMTAANWNVVSGRLLGQELRPFIDECLKEQNVPYELKSLRFTAIRVVNNNSHGK